MTNTCVINPNIILLGKELSLINYHNSNSLEFTIRLEITSSSSKGQLYCLVYYYDNNAHASTYKITNKEVTTKLLNLITNNHPIFFVGLDSNVAVSLGHHVFKFITYWYKFPSVIDLLKYCPLSSTNKAQYINTLHLKQIGTSTPNPF